MGIKSIKLNEKQWHIVLSDIKSMYSPSVYLIREKMKTKLGFTMRDEPVYNKETYRREYKYTLDFFNENKRTMFLLKYAEHLNDK